jgi:hypothetical protein
MLKKIQLKTPEMLGTAGNLPVLGKNRPVTNTQRQKNCQMSEQEVRGG